ncbi:NAD(P)/FAD-dependent oxidoreductase [Sediminibacter sp. Hel_I_10]|uniref:NAD(P)/FAD-dependent oxidoreductase n=1 Tax=Sediminibacter sp. Hel_I_10 TaxID=1392490 RepID=UPI00047EB3B9|nr:NAD(P)/FAD-dependent oxidoreductase [Sediminibacter sp. Hel_I_10]
MQLFNSEILIIGGGLAGLCSAIHLSKAGFAVVVIEKNSYPKHKVCGEYVSNEVLPYLEYLGIDVFAEGAKRISKMELTTSNNKKISQQLPLGGFGISRFRLDALLAEKAMANGVKMLQNTVSDIIFKNDRFQIETKEGATFESKIAIGAFGKRSNLDVNLKRDFIKEKSPYLGVKIHVKGDFPEDLVALHNFKGGYCGLSKVETNAINLCYITSFKAFKKHKDIENFQQNVLFKNKALKHVFKSTTPCFDQPLTISQISFETKNPVENHVLMCGDAAGMIHPLCGNGMGMAIRSAQLASQLIINYLHEKIASRDMLEKAYTSQWNATFQNRLRAGHLIAALFRNDRLASMALQIVKWCPWLLVKIIKRTHGEPMQIS